MTQRVARPIKFAAFISIIVSVAVMFVACQGAVGPQGPPGEDGEDGDDAGTPLELRVLQERTASPRSTRQAGDALLLPVYINDGETVGLRG